MFWCLVPNSCHGACMAHMQCHNSLKKIIGVIGVNVRNDPRIPGSTKRPNFLRIMLQGSTNRSFASISSVLVGRTSVTNFVVDT